MRDRDQRIQRRGRALVELVARRLPQEFEVSGDGDAWPGVGVGLLSRMTTTLESMLELQPAQRQADAATLLRSLYEHAVHFAWLAADPGPSRLKQWREHDELMNARAVVDAHDHGVELTDQDPEIAKARAAELRGTDLKIEQLAVAADTFWAERLPGMRSHRERESFRGLYAILYRHFSGMAHPSRRGLNRVYDDLGGTRRRIRLEGYYLGNGPYSVAAVVFGIALFVASSSLGWPSQAEIDAAFDDNPV